MSYVTDLIISFSVSDVDKASLIEAHFIKLGFPPPKLVSERREDAGGNAALQKTVLIGAFNHFTIDSLQRYMESLKWYLPEDVQLLACFEATYPHIFEDRLDHSKMKTRKK